MFTVVPFISSTGLAIVAEANLRFGDSLSEKNCRHSTGSFSIFLVLTPRHSLSFHKFEKQSCLFGVDNAFFTCCCYLGVLYNCCQFVSVESCLFMCLSVIRFLSLQVFPFLITASG